MNALREILLDKFIAELFSALAIFLKLDFSNLIVSFKSQLFEGGVSHIVAAALETKGLVDQAKILANLTTLNEIAGLFYIFAIVMAVGSVAVFGSYRQGLYFLLGPTFYVFMVSQTTQTNGVKAKLGNFELPNSVARQSSFLNEIRAIDGNGTADVSLFFAAFDGIVSELFRQINALLLDTENREHLKIVAREQVLEYLLLAQPTSGVVSSMIERHHGTCSPIMNRYYAAGKDKKDQVKSRRRDQGDVDQQKADADKEFANNTVTFGAHDKEIRRFLISQQGTEGFPADLGVGENDPIKVSCKDLWTYIMATLKQVAKKSLDPDYFKGTKEGADDGEKEAAYKDTKKFLADTAGGSNAEDALTVYQYRNYLNKSSHSALNDQIFKNSPFNAKEYEVAFGEIPGAEARGAFFGLRYFAAAIPYIQGLLLYLLAIGFPFFAVLLVIPGRAASFLMWCALWAWVKSWDVGFAAVLVVKDMYWEMLKHSQNPFDNKIDLSDPFSVFAVALNSDPLANIRTYWEVSYAFTVGVPFLTAHLFLGATDLFDMFKNGIDQTAGRFRQFETQGGRRAIANLIEASQGHQKFQTGIEYGKALNAMAPKDTGNFNGSMLNLRGAQTTHGFSVAESTVESAYDKQNAFHRAANVRQGYAQVANNVAITLSQVGTPEIINRLAGEQERVFEIEKASIASLGGKQSQGVYSMPETFRKFADLDRMVPKPEIMAAMEAYEGNIKTLTANERTVDEARKLQFDLGKDYTYEQFMMLQAQQQQKVLVVPHVMRAMPSLDASVPKEALENIFQDPNHETKAIQRRHPMLQAADAGETIRWRDVFQEVKDDQRTHYAALAATVGRRHMPDTSGAVNTFSDAVNMGEVLANYARTAGTGKEEVPGRVAIPGYEFILERLTRGDLSPEKPGFQKGHEAGTGNLKGETKPFTVK